MSPKIKFIFNPPSMSGKITEVALPESEQSTIPEQYCQMDLYILEDIHLYPAITMQHRHIYLYDYISFVAKSNLLITNLLTNLHSSIPKLRLHYGSDDDGAIKGGHGIFEVPRWQVAPVVKCGAVFFFSIPEGGLGIMITLKITPNYKARTLTGVGF